MTEADGKTGKSHEPAVWTTLRTLLGSHKDDPIELQCSRKWDDLRTLDDDVFRNVLAESDAYAAFFVRALIGNPDSAVNVFETNCVTTTHTNGKANISIPSALVCHLTNTDDKAFIGADLVARVALTVARSISNTSGCQFTPRLDCYKHTGNGSRDLRFMSADFVEAAVKDTRQITSNTPTTKSADDIVCCPNEYYHFGWDGREPPGTWNNHGWRAESERGFVNNPNAEKMSNEIETFLGFPAFYKHDEASAIFVLPPADGKEAVNSPTGCSSHEILFNQGIKPYVAMKQEEYSGRKGEQSKGCIVLCLGVSDQRAAYFNPGSLRNAYGVFLTIDLECGVCELAENREKPCGNQDFLQKIVADLRGIQYEIKYQTLHVLTGKLLNTVEEQSTRLQKSDQMLRQLTTPLQVLSDSIGKTQAEVQEIRAILYEPMEAIFALQGRIAQYFAQNHVIENPDGSRTRISHQPGHYKSEGRIADAQWVLARILATIRGKEIFLASSKEALAYELSILCNAKNDKANPFHQLAVTMLAFIDYDDTYSTLLEAPVAALNAVKQRLFQPFKPDEALAPIDGDVIAALLPTAADIYGLESFRAKDIAIPASINPFATQGHLLRFISGVVSATFNSDCKTFRIICDDKGITIIRQDGRPWIASENISKLFKVLLREIYTFWNGTRPLEENWGDHADPFVRLLRRLPPQYQESENALISQDDSNSLKIQPGTPNNGLFSCICQGKEISIKIDQLEIDYGEKFYVGKFVESTL